MGSGLKDTEKKNKTFFVKTLDKSSQLCYNKYTEMRKGNGEEPSPRERVRPFRQRHLTARCVGLRDTNVNQSPKAEAMWDYADYKAN